MGVESLQEAGEERARDWKNWKFFCNIVQYFAIGKAHTGETIMEGDGNLAEICMVQESYSALWV